MFKRTLRRLRLAVNSSGPLLHVSWEAGPSFAVFKEQNPRRAEARLNLLSAERGHEWPLFHVSAESFRERMIRFRSE